jgi:hypothetical protein
MKRTDNVVFSLASVAAILTSGIAAIAIWLLLAQPLSMANAVNTGDLSALVRTIVNALEAIVRYL